MKTKEPTTLRAKTTVEGPKSVLELRRPPTSPGEMLLEEFLRPTGLTQAEAARRMQISSGRLNAIIRGRRGITADTALRLARLSKTSPEFWMGLQTDWDLWHAARARRRGRVPNRRQNDQRCSIGTIRGARVEWHV